MELACTILGHARSRHRTRVANGKTISRCRRCMVRMVRGENGRWRVAEPDELASLYEPAPGPGQAVPRAG